MEEKGYQSRDDSCYPEYVKETHGWRVGEKIDDWWLEESCHSKKYLKFSLAYIPELFCAAEAWCEGIARHVLERI